MTQDDSCVNTNGYANLASKIKCTTPLSNINVGQACSLANLSASSEPSITKLCEKQIATFTKSPDYSMDAANQDQPTTAFIPSNGTRLGRHNRQPNIFQQCSGTSSSVKLRGQPSKSYARVCRGNKAFKETSLRNLPLCEYAIEGECPNPIGQCSYLHGLICDLCERPCLHPYNTDQQMQHREVRYFLAPAC